ncbi:MAG TPA: O-antigen ligase family protein [Dehalococcoidia bacterium]|nr:O-antigen ligase family protein [Dehalococcoidia bacterium]
MNLRLLRAEALALPALSEDRREGLLTAVRALTYVAFSTLIVLSPFRARFELVSRPDTPVYGDYTDFLLYWSDVAFLAFLALWGLSLLIGGRLPRFGPAAIRWPVFGLLAVTWLSATASIDPALSAYNALRLTAAAALALFVINEIDSVSRLAPALAVMVVLQGAVGIGQAIDQASVGLHELGELHLEVNAGGTSVIWSDEGPRQLRAYGLSDHPNILGGLLALALVLVAAAATRSSDLWRAPLAVVFALGCAALLLTFSRAGVLALGFALLLALGLFAYRRDWRNAGAWAAVALGGVIICLALVKPYGDELWQRGVVLDPSEVSSTEQRSLSEREALVKVSNDVFVARPLLGVGAGTLPKALKDGWPDFAYDYQPAHFALLTVAAETGIVGGMTYGALMVVPFVLLWWRRRELTPELIGVSGALLAVTLIGLFDYYTWSLAPGRIWFWLVLGLWAAAYMRRREVSADA